MSQINKIAVIGAGNMGSGIVQKIAQEGLKVVIIDLKDEYVERGLGIIRQMLQEGVERKIFKPEQVDEVFSRIEGTSDFNAAAICSNDGRHLAMMPHLERAIFPWQWAYYPEDRPADAVSPWIEAFVNARKWIEKKK